MKTISDWQKEAHALAVEKGWYEGVTDNLSPTRIGSRLALIHGEISEALDCVSKGKMALYYSFADGSTIPGPNPITQTAAQLGAIAKPEGFPIELADVFLRLCDFAESMGIQMDEPFAEASYAFSVDNPESVAFELNELHNSLSACQWSGPGHQIDGYVLSGCLSHLFCVAAATGVDLLAMAELKMAYNRTRPHRHGGKTL
jgi:NTP pyrophosphatase (non-canonical NTP hydrolase)